MIRALKWYLVFVFTRAHRTWPEAQRRRYDGALAE